MRLAPGKRVLTEEEERFKHALLEAVDEGLGVLGQNVKATIYFEVEKRGSLCREEIPEKLQAFTRALREIFGVGGPVIERLIAKRLLHNLELAYNERRDYGLIEYVEEARQRFEGAADVKSPR